MKFKSKIHHLIRGYFDNSLFRNSFYLMLATASLAGFGFFFWVITARLFVTEEIGLATTLISIMNLIALLSLIGFDTAFVRFLPTSEHRNDKMNTGILLVGIASIVLSSIFIGSINMIAPRLSFVTGNSFYIIIFILACVMNSINVLTDAVFLAGRQAKFTLIINITLSIFKLIVPFAFIGFGAMGIFIAAALAQTLGTILSIAVMTCKFDFRPTYKIDKGVLSLVWKYSTANYLAGVFNLLPPTILPILITNYISASASAYYYIVMMIGNMLYTIPWSTSKSIFAEGSHNETELGKNIKQSLKTTTILLIPSTIVLFLGGSTILQIFGKEYANGGTNFLYLVTFAALPIMINSIFGTFFRVKKDLRAIVIMNIIYISLIIGFSYVLLPLGLAGIGLAWVAGNTLAAIMSYVLYVIKSQKEPFWEHLDHVFYDFQVIITYKLINFLTSRKKGHKHKTILFYPDKPQSFHALYKICNILGYTMTSDPTSHFDSVIAFEDITIRTPNKILDGLAKKRKVINYNCGDITKERVEKIFKEAFGYGMAVNPLTFKGECVRKSDTNALHDGTIIECPAKPEKGYIYQKLVNNIYDGKVIDIRIPIIGNTIPYVCERYKDPEDRFDNTLFSALFEVNEKLSKEEIAKILEFTKKFGLDFGEIDTIRDGKNGKLYIVDVNNTPTGPRNKKHIAKSQYKIYLQKLADGLERELL